MSKKAFSCILQTAGNGYWSNISKTVRITALELKLFGSDDFGELRVYFDKNTWNVDIDGLIYTDELFLSELKDTLNKAGINSNIWYSEQGMQDDKYVSFDVEADFIKSWQT